MGEVSTRASPQVVKEPPKSVAGDGTHASLLPTRGHDDTGRMGKSVMGVQKICDEKMD